MIQNYLIKLENVISNAYHWGTFRKLPLTINYGNFKTVIRFNPKEANRYYCEANWVHTGAPAMVGSDFKKIKLSKWHGLCLGTDARISVKNILLRRFLSRQEKERLLAHVLYDYYSVCLSDHTEIMGVPQDVTYLTNEDLFICRKRNRCFHKSMMHPLVKNVSKIAITRNINEYFDMKDIDSYPIDIYKFKECLCGSFNKKTNKQCFYCKAGMK